MSKWRNSPNLCLSKLLVGYFTSSNAHQMSGWFLRSQGSLHVACQAGWWRSIDAFCFTASFRHTVVLISVWCVCAAQTQGLYCKLCEG
jgi:hypothetical protein